MGFDRMETPGHWAGVLLMLGVMLCVSIPARAAEDGRYRAVVLHEGGRSDQYGALIPKVFILDSRDGHMWTWEQNSRLSGEKGSISFGTVLTYQGQIKPGKQMGEVMEQRQE